MEPWVSAVLIVCVILLSNVLSFILGWQLSPTKTETLVVYVDTQKEKVLKRVRYF